MRSRFYLAGALACALALAGCGSDEAPASEDQDSDGSPVTLIVQRESAEGPPAADVIDEQLDAALNIDLQLSTAEGGEYYNQLAASMAGGNPPDLFIADRARLRQFIDQGLILDITDYMEDGSLEEYADFVEPETRSGGQFNGKFYGIARKTGAFYASYWIRKDWLDNLGLGMPETVEELMEVARAFTEDDPDGNGENDTYGLTGNSAGSAFAPLWAAFGSGGPGQLGSPGTFYVKDGEVLSGYVDPATKEALEYIQQLVGSGYVDPDFVTSEQAQAHERALQGTAGILYNSWSEMTKPEFVEQYKVAQPDAEWVQLAPPRGPAGQGVPRDAGPAGGMWAIPQAVGEDEVKLQKIFDLINYVSSEEGNRVVMYGVEGEHYTVEDGSVVPTDKLDEEGGYFWMYQLTGRDDGDYLPTKFAAQAEYIDFANSQPFFENYSSLVVAPEGSSGDTERFIEEQFAQFVSGARPVGEYDAFVDSLMNEFGYEDYLDAAREQLAGAGVTS